MSSVIADAQQRIRSGRSSGKEQYLLWKTSLATAAEDDDGGWAGAQRKHHRLTLQKHNFSSMSTGIA